MRFFLFLFLIPGIFNLNATEIEVCKSCKISSIAEAVEIAVDGDVIRIKKGVYNEFDIKIINKSIRIVGEDYPVIDAGMKGTAFSVQADNFTIEGLNIRNIGKSHTREFAAILVANSTNFVIRNNILENIFFGILVERSSKGRITGNKVSSNATQQDNSGNGIHLFHSEEIHVSKNHVSGTRDGIYLEFANNVVVSDNICKNNLRYGLHFMFSNDNEYLDNLFESNGAGVAVMFSKNIKMYRNVFRKSWGSASYGLLLKEINDAELKHNIFESNTVGISADGTNRINYIENDFKNNGYGIKIRGACYKNVFTGNNFLYNAFDVAYSGLLNENVFDRNYWSGYSGYDLDRDGTGDVPHRPVKLFSYLVNRSPEAIVMLRSLFIDIIDFSEKVSPIFTPAELIDANPKTRQIKW
ncbi:MAG TPA: nitrous oxide reductase family maturation protein NosD [Gillisia sp.]|nr:nitrous oxide reductase family maturation protein NosD [Gillisia sp.]